MKFIRRGGRIIPIREKTDGESKHGKMAVAGLVSGAVVRAGTSFKGFKNVKGINIPEIKFGKRSKIISTAI